MSLHDQFGALPIDEILTRLATEHHADSPSASYLRSLLSTRTAEMVTAQLRGTAETIGKSANELGPKLDRLNQELGETKAKIETAGQELTAALGQATGEFQTASTQSSQLGRRLNWLTGALFFAATLTAGATIFQAYETKRQADLIQDQLRQQKRSLPAVPKSVPESNTPGTPTQKQ